MSWQVKRSLSILFDSDSNFLMGPFFFEEMECQRIGVNIKDQYQGRKHFVYFYKPTINHLIYVKQKGK